MRVALMQQGDVQRLTKSFFPRRVTHRAPVPERVDQFHKPIQDFNGVV
jgi:hypothetical protein